jgi:SAM-dependent methyltransferase
MAGVSELTNPVERRRWNDDYWSSVWPRREQLTGAVTGILIGHLALSAGERVLDVGSGAGIASLAAAEQVGPTGVVVGADISAPLVSFAGRRAAAAQVDHVRFVVADVQHDAVEGGPFDVAMSQFGVMFFDRAAIAFAHIAALVRPGGRLGFACWQPIDDNPWHIGHAVGPYATPAAPPAEGNNRTGPFTLADPERTTELLTGAGWADVTRTPYEVTARVTRDAIVDDDQVAYLGVPDDRLAEARVAIDAHMDRMAVSNGMYDAPLAFQVFTARRA